MTNVFTVSIQESRIIKLDYPLLVHVLSVCMHHVQRGNGGWGQGMGRDTDLIYTANIPSGLSRRQLVVVRASEAKARKRRRKVCVYLVSSLVRMLGQATV